MSRSPLSARPRHWATRRVVTFPILLAIAIAIVSGEIALLFLLPYATDRYQKRMDHAQRLMEDPAMVLREHESLQMIPPNIGVLYRRQVAIAPAETESLFTQLLALDDGGRLRLLQTKHISEEAYIALLGRCFAGGPQEARLEEFLIRAVPQLEGSGYLAHLASTHLHRTYFYAGERSQYAGLIDDARRAYRRFIELGRLLNRDTALGVDMHRHLSRASVRLKILAAEHAFAASVMQEIQEGPADVSMTFIKHGDPRLAALARYNAASFLWHDDRMEEAVALLKEADCDSLHVECSFLLAKITDSQADIKSPLLGTVPTADESQAFAREARAILDELMRELPDRHPLLDDLYFHRALVARHRDDKPAAYAALRELQRRCPNTDLLADMRFLSDELSGRIDMGLFDE